MDMNFLGSVADAVPKLTEQFNRKYQANQLAIADANARAAEANAQATGASPLKNNWMLYGIIAGAVVLVVIVILMTHGK